MKRKLIFHYAVLLFQRKICFYCVFMLRLCFLMCFYGFYGFWVTFSVFLEHQNMLQASTQISFHYIFFQKFIVAFLIFFFAVENSISFQIFRFVNIFNGDEIAGELEY